MHEATKVKAIIKRLGIFAYLILVLTSCSMVDPDDDESEGGIIGTGLRLNGTVTDVRQFASNSLQIISNSGELSNADIDGFGRFSAPSVKGDAPFLIRADLGNNEYRYAISFGEERTNVHSYSDVIMRNWFAANNGELDSEFEQQVLSTELPTRAQFQSNSQAIFSLVSLILDTYELTGEQLLSGDYDSVSDPDGIDNYLRANPVVIKDNQIAIVITDPVTNTQSTTRSSFSLYELADEPDTESPQIPTSVRALPSASDEIVIVWEPSTDNRGVVGYEIFRDDTLIATTPFPVFTDGGLETNLEYTYYITAIDGSGNTSASSIPAITDTLGELDDIPPPSPVQLTVSPFPGQMELIWGQSDIGDVVSFDVYRGLNEDSIEALTTVTSTFMTDVTISSGVDYCYQVVAVDASGNESERSALACETAAGEEVGSSDQENESPVLPLAGLNIPDIDSMDCTNEWSDYSITTELTVERGCYLVNQSIDVSNGGQLNLVPGTVLKFGPNTWLRVRFGGSLRSIGTRDEPIVLTSQVDMPGYWNGVTLSNSDSLNNKITNSVVEYAGGDGTGAIAIISTLLNTSSLEITNSLIRECAGTGIFAPNIFNNVRLLDGTIVSGCEAPLTIHPSMLAGVTQRNEFRQNENAKVNLTSDTNITENIVLKNIGVPYSPEGDLTLINGSLTVQEGVQLTMPSESSIRIVGTSYLNINGSSAAPVNITSSIGTAGAWVGILLQGGSTMNVIEHANISFGGGGAQAIPGNIWIDCRSASLRIRNSLLTDSLGWGIGLENAGTCNVDLGDNVQFARNRIGTINIEQ